METLPFAWCTRPITLLLAAILVGCGGGQESPSNAAGTEPASDSDAALGIVLDAPQTVDATNRIALTWRTQGAPTSFTVFVQRVQGEAFSAVDSATVTATSAQFARGTAWKYDFPTARVRVQACDAQERCVQSNEQPLVDALVGGIAKLEPDPLSSADGIFLDVRFSDDGNTMVELTVPKVTLYRRGEDGAWAREATPGVPERDGFALSGDGNTMVFGWSFHRGTVGGIDAPEAEPPPGPFPFSELRGAVVVYVRDAAGAWQRQSFIKASTPADTARFGHSVALSRDGNRMAVGTHTQGPAGTPKIYLFKREGGVWRQDRIFADRPYRILAPGERTLAISADGRTIAVRVDGWRTEFDEGGTPYDIPRYMLHVYRQCVCGDGWELAAEIESPLPWGYVESYPAALSLSADGKTLAVGSHEDVGGGAIYVYGEGTDRTWSQRAFIQAAAPTYDQLGQSVQLRADGRAIAASACGRAANTPGVRRLHRADALPPDIESRSFCSATNFYIFELGADGRWAHTAAALVPDAFTLYGPLGASADLETIGGTTVSFAAPGAPGNYAAAVY